jgi:hypothetical protein
LRTGLLCIQAPCCLLDLWCRQDRWAIVPCAVCLDCVLPCALTCVCVDPCSLLQVFRGVHTADGAAPFVVHPHAAGAAAAANAEMKSTDNTATSCTVKVSAVTTEEGGRKKVEEAAEKIMGAGGEEGEGAKVHTLNSCLLYDPCSISHAPAVLCCQFPPSVVLWTSGFLYRHSGGSQGVLLLLLAHCGS